MVGSSNNYIPVTEHRKGLPAFGVFPLHCSTSGGVKLPWVKPTESHFIHTNIADTKLPEIDGCE
jgi:hypothetical protein